MGSVFLVHHIAHHQQNVKPHAYKHQLFKGTCCLSLYCCHFNKFNKESVCVCKDAASGTKANSEADVPNEENMAREGGIIQLVWGEVNVLYAYIIRGERELTTPSLYMTMRWQAQVGCSVMNAVLPSLLKDLCIIRSPECTTAGQKLFVRLLFIAGSPLRCAALLLQGSFQCMEPDGEQRTQRGLGTAMYCSARSSAMHTHSLPFLLCL